MNDELRAKLNAITEEAPDALDLAMLEDAKQTNDGSMIALDAFKASLEGYNGKVLLRMPKSLHKRLAEEAQIEGVSLNQYALYKLSQ